MYIIYMRWFGKKRRKKTMAATSGGRLSQSGSQLAIDKLLTQIRAADSSPLLCSNNRGGGACPFELNSSFQIQIFDFDSLSPPSLLIPFGIQFKNNEILKVKPTLIKN